MISVIVSTDRPFGNMSSDSKLHEMYAWLGTYVVNNWALSRLTIDKVKVDFWGSDQEQEIVAFKLKFCGVGGRNG